VANIATKAPNGTKRRWDCTAAAENGTVSGYFEGRAADDDSKPAMLLVGGMKSDIDSLGSLAAALRDDFDVVGVNTTYSRELYGKSTATLGNFAMAAHQGAKVAFGTRPFSVFGHSYGGIVAQELAALHPESVNKVILHSTVPGLASIPMSPMAAAVMATPFRPADMMGIIYGGPFRRPENRALGEELGLAKENVSPDAAAEYRLKQSALCGLVLGGIYRHLQNLNRLGRNHDTLVVADDDDPIVQRGNEVILSNILNGAYPAAPLFPMRNRSQLVITHGLGHMGPMVDPEGTAETIVAFHRNTNI
jgi:pimeloyl-ACP methyl ester carboxylesterase